MIYIKKYQKEKETLIAACDEDILGKKFTQGQLKLNIKETFYKGDLKDVEDLDTILPEATIANLAGNRVVDRAVELGFVDSNSIMEIGGVKHAQMAVIL